jgi:arylsulfatase A-like enzyme
MKTFLPIYVLLTVMAVQGAVLTNYNVIWDSPSVDSLDSMPLSGRSGAGANVWVQDGSLWLYLGHSGAYDEQGRLLKLGCLRITPVGLKLGGSGFRQELDLSSGAITIQQGEFKAAVWFAGETLVFESESGTADALDVAFGTWRDQKRAGIRQDMFDGRGDFSPDQITADADGFLWFHRNADFAGDVVGMAKAQGIPAESVCDATTKRIFGAAVRVEGGISKPVESVVQWQFWEGKAWTGRTATRTKHTVAMRLGAAINADPKQWSTEAKAALSPAFRKNAKKDELKRWSEFWSRSHVFINQQFSPSENQQSTINTLQSSPFLISRNYQLFRYMLACNRDGELPLLFNGGIFTTDNKPGRITGNNNDELPLSEGGPITPDFRRWMGCRFMAQNQRWLGWPTLANGDADLLAPSLAFYRDRSTTAAARARTLAGLRMASTGGGPPAPLVSTGGGPPAPLASTGGGPPAPLASTGGGPPAPSRAGLEPAIPGRSSIEVPNGGAEGVVYPEPLDVWGLCCVAPRPDGLCGAEHLTYHFSMMLEHAWMALQARDDLGIDIAKDLSWIEGTVKFYDSFYRAEHKRRTGQELGGDGKLVIYPANGLEYASGATNPIEVVCALKRITESLLRLPTLSTESRARFQKIEPTLPDLPIGVRQGRQSLLEAKSFEKAYNIWEPIEMYACWPYRLAGIVKPDTLQLARDTWETIPEDRAKLCKQDFSWMANVANMAALAWPEEAKKRAIYKLANTAAPQARFPAFFGPGHDWLPDHNWGGSGMTGLQEMILAPEPGPTGKLNLFPAWPVEWDVDFKLHAPGQTIVEGVLRGGQLVQLKVTPKSRAKDIVNWLDKQPAAAKPNIIIILTDDQGYGDFSCTGNPILKTPNMDRLHDEGVRFKDFHACPTCAPTRSALLSGAHEFKSGVTHTILERERMSLKTITLAQVLKSAGYTTGIFGKWHLGDEDAYQPEKRGFDEVFIHGGGGIGQTFPGSCGDVPDNTYFDPVIKHNGTFEKTTGFCTDVFTAQALKWIELRKGKNPFFCFITYNAPHGPLFCPLRFKQPYQGKVPDDVATFYGMLANIDENVGQLLVKLKEWGIARNTLVIFMNDNGGYASACKIYNAGMKGSKCSAWEGGTRAASFWRWPAALKPADVDQLTSVIDVFPTLAELAGVTLDQQVKVQVEGRSLVPLLKNPQAPWPDRNLITHVGRWGGWKPGTPPEKYGTGTGQCSSRNSRYSLVRGNHDWELFDIKADPGQSHNIAARHPDIVKPLAAAYDRWWFDIQPYLVNENAYKTAPAVNPFKQQYWKQFAGNLLKNVQSSQDGSTGTPRPTENTGVFTR